MGSRGRRIFVAALWGWTALSLGVFALRMSVLWR